MDLGIAGKKALVCAASKGLGRACALSLADNGVDVTIVARTQGRWKTPPRKSARPRESR
jgi:3-oxoacyl-[acyl-carrier protein] reductase